MDTPQKSLRIDTFFLLVVGFCSVLSGCQEYIFSYRPNQRVVITTIREVILKNSNTDIVFVIDNSHSMLEEQVNLMHNTKVFVQVLAESENAYHLGILSTDMIAETDGGRFRLERATDTQLIQANPEFIPGVDLQLDLPCSNTTRDPNTAGLPYLVRPSLTSDNLEAERCHLVKDFMATVASLGIGGDAREAGLEAVRRALDTENYASVVEANGDFLREKADLAVIFLTDEDDCSFEKYDDAFWDPWDNALCYDYRHLGLAPEFYVDFLSGVKGNPPDPRKLRVALIGGGVWSGESNKSFEPKGCIRPTLAGQTLPSDNCGCWSSSGDDFFCELLSEYGHPCNHEGACITKDGDVWVNCPSTLDPNVCDTPRCEALPSNIYYRFADELGKRRKNVGFTRGIHLDSICQDNYASTLETIARTVVLDEECFDIEQAPLDFDKVKLVWKHTDFETGEVTKLDVPMCTWDETNQCTDCLEHPTGAWRYDEVRGICLACGLKKQTGDDFSLTMLNEIVGVENE